MTEIYIALGANLSNPKETFIEALKVLKTKGVSVIKLSGLWQSPSWPPGKGHPDYLNAVAEVSFKGRADELLEILNDVEADFGRIRSERNAPRTLDLDIVDFKGEIWDTENLTLPHPRMLERGFVLFPLEQVAPDWTEPKSRQGIMNYIARLPLSDMASMKYIGALLNEV